MHLELKRFESTSKSTLGHLFVRDRDNQVIAIFATIERPWLNNERNKSCIPVGKYQIRHRYSIKYGKHLQIHDVVGRSLILIHQGNYVTQTEGCVLVGYFHQDIDNNGTIDVGNSSIALKALVALLWNNSTYLEVSDICDLEVL